MNYYTPNAELETAPKVKKSVAFTQKWITDRRPPPVLGLFAEELILEVAGWCLDPASLLNLSSTCRSFSDVLRTPKVWLSHHWGRGYDIGVLTKKATRAAAAGQYGRDGWGILVKSAFDKAEFPDDSHLTQWNMGKPLPHLATSWELDPDAVEKYQARGEKWMRVFYDIVTEHYVYNFDLYPYLHDEALMIRVKSEQGRYYQAIICSTELLIRMWVVPDACMNSFPSRINSLLSLEELPVHDEQSTSLTSLTKAFLIGKKFMEIIPEAQTQRRLFPHPGFGPEIWESPDGNIDPKGTGWVQKVVKSWKGTVYVVGQYSIWNPEHYCPYNKLKLGPAVFRMCLDFQADGQIIGRGSDFGGKFTIVSGSYRQTYVELVKRYDDDEDPDTYHAKGHMTPWGVFGSWYRPDEPDRILGFWVMWHFEGAPMICLKISFKHKNGRLARSTQFPYKAVPGWFEEFERLRDTGKFIERYHGYKEDPPRAPEDIPLPDIDAFGL